MSKAAPIAAAYINATPDKIPVKPSKSFSRRPLYSLELGIIDSNRFGEANSIQAEFDSISTQQFCDVSKPNSADKLVLLSASIANANSHCTRPFALHIQLSFSVIALSVCHKLLQANPTRLSWHHRDLYLLLAAFGGLWHDLSATIQ